MPSSGERKILHRAEQLAETAGFVECHRWKESNRGLYSEMRIQMADNGRWYVTGIDFGAQIQGATDGKQD